MKKIIINILLIIMLIITCFLQLNLFTWFNIAGVMPNVFIIILLFIGLFLNKNMGIIYGILLGIILDLNIGRSIGISSIMFSIVGFLGGFFDKNFSKENRMTLIVMVFVSTIIYECGAYFLGYIILRTGLELIEFIKILLVECLYNSLILIILYPMFQTFGYEIEKEYKGNKILTRYF